MINIHSTSRQEIQWVNQVSPFSYFEMTGSDPDSKILRENALFVEFWAPTDRESERKDLTRKLICQDTACSGWHGPFMRNRPLRTLAKALAKISIDLGSSQELSRELENTSYFPRDLFREQNYLSTLARTLAGAPIPCQLSRDRVLARVWSYVGSGH